MASDAPPHPAAGRRRFLRYLDPSQHPRIALAVILLGVYGASLRQPFMVDDYRNLRMFRAYDAGRSAQLDLYEFAFDRSTIAAERRAGFLPWWVRDELRFRFFRPLAEWSLWLDWKLFGDHPLGFRFVNLALYYIAVCLLPGFYGRFAEPPVARWAAFLFGVAGSHAATVIFPAARCDLLALIAGILAAHAMAAFLARGRPLWLIGALACLAAGVCSKESAVPLALMPIPIFVALRTAAAATVPRGGRRAIVASVCCIALILGFVGWYVTNGYGSNSSMMLDPAGATADYLLRAPFRALLLLSSWLLLMNPIILYFRETFQPLLIVYGVIGTAALLLVVRKFRRHHRGDRSVAGMALWVLMFLPLFGCNPADSRILMLPSIGLSFLAARWIAGNFIAGRNVALPVLLFLVGSFAGTGVTIGSIEMLERVTRSQYDAAVAAFGRPVERGDYVFVVNIPVAMWALWAQDRLNEHRGNGDLRIAALTDVAGPHIRRVGPSMLRISAGDEAILSSFVGRMGSVRGAVPDENWVADSDEYTVRPVRVENGRIREIEVRFRRPIDSEHYRFIELSFSGEARVVPVSEFRVEPASTTSTHQASK